MGRLQAIARSIVQAIVNGTKKRRNSPLALIFTLLSTIFSFYELPLHRHRPDVFGELRQDYWDVREDDYVASFRADEGEKPEGVLNTMGDMGFSGSVRSKPASYWNKSPANMALFSHSSQPRTKSTSSSPSHAIMNTRSSATTSSTPMRSIWPRIQSPFSFGSATSLRAREWQSATS